MQKIIEKIGWAEKEKPECYRETFDYWTKTVCPLSKEWLLVLHDDNLNPKELYKLRSDPGQKNNVYLKNKDTALNLESRLKEWEASLPSYKDQEYSFPPEIDKATQERIRKTGYW